MKILSDFDQVAAASSYFTNDRGFGSFVEGVA